MPSLTPRLRRIKPPCGRFCPARMAGCSTMCCNYAVTYSGQTVFVRASDELAALFTAAKHWGYKFTRPEYHQNAAARKLHYTPGL